MHIAFILDGNRRWARQKGWRVALGHRSGFDNFLEIVKHCATDTSIKTVSAFALSTENLQRSDTELNNLFQIFTDFCIKYRQDLIDHDIQVHFVGNLQLLPRELQETFAELTEVTKDCGGKLLLQICVAYGGQDELVRAAHQLAAEQQAITAESLAAALDSANGGPIDLLIRTGNKQRVSNFLLWQLAYAELYFSDKMWPDFDVPALQTALKDFAERKRTFGK